MALLSIPDTPQDITSQWLIKALHSTGISLNATIKSLCIEPIAVLTCAGQLARLHLNFNRPHLPRNTESKWSYWIYLRYLLERLSLRYVTLLCPSSAYGGFVKFRK